MSVCECASARETTGVAGYQRDQGVLDNCQGDHGAWRSTKRLVCVCVCVSVYIFVGDSGRGARVAAG